MRLLTTTFFPILASSGASTTIWPTSSLVNGLAERSPFGYQPILSRNL
ncbi:unnamed protein product [Protopolystoma xenopodis]|uniref:Uncharacterized protein n=1 Tax=Protopolystoma xenopodis TaxID=117903 RepID=A0A3S5BCN2_9PLAT|nr:unnamed protein product [Protopolystoma xenopodis]